MIRRLLEDLSRIVEGDIVEGDERLRDLERKIAAGPAGLSDLVKLVRAKQRVGTPIDDALLIALLRHGEKPSIDTRPRPKARANMKDEDIKSRETVITLHGTDLARAEWSLYPNAWPSAEAAVEAIFVRPGFENQLGSLFGPHDRNVEDVLLAYIGRQAAHATLHPMHGQIRPLEPRS